MPGAKIINRQSYMGFSEGTQHRQRVRGIGHGGAFRYLEHQPLSGDVIGVQQFTDFCAEIRFPQVDCRDVDGNRGVTLQLIQRLAELQGPHNDPAGHGFDQPGLLCHRDEFIGRHQAVFGMLPADQGLKAGHSARLQVDLGLEMQRQVVGAQRFAQIRHQHQAARAVGVHLGVVDRNLPMKVMMLVKCNERFTQQT